MKLSLVPNYSKLKTQDTLNKVITYLDQNDVTYEIIDLDSRPDDKSDCLLYFGGDGTFIKTAKMAYKYDLPLAGINTGNYGYLTNSSIDDCLSWLHILLKSDLKYESCPVLYTDDVIINDVVLYTKGSFGHFKVYLDDKLIYKTDSSGLIISTGLGSTGINLSAHGPILFKDSKDVILTPIFALRGSDPSLVFEFESKITIECDTEFYIDIDGERQNDTKCVIMIQRAEHSIKRIDI